MGAATAHKDPVWIQRLDAVYRSLGIEADIDPELFQLIGHGLDEPEEVILVHILGRQVQGSPELAVGLKEGHLKAAPGKDPSRLHAGHTTADDHHLPAIAIHLRPVKLKFPAQAGVDRAFQVSSPGNGFDAAEAANTFPNSDVFTPAGLVGPFWIGQLPAAHGNKITDPFFKELFSYLRFFNIVD